MNGILDRSIFVDALIGATAVRHHLPVYTQDDDFAEFPGLRVVRA